MKISYQREMKRNYLIVEPELPERTEEFPFEQKMLEQNQIDGILRFQVRQKDSEIRFFYEITSKQPLTRLLEGQTVQAPQIRTLVAGIARALDHMEQYLLGENCVLMDPEYLYVDPENLRVWLCLIPGMERDFPEDYSRFLEYLLGKVDHKDKESVVLAYGLYQETRKENYGMGDILRLAEQKSGENGSNYKRGTDTDQWNTDQWDADQRDAGPRAVDQKAVGPRPVNQRAANRKDVSIIFQEAERKENLDRQENEWQPGMVRTKRIQTDTQEEAAGLFGRWKQWRKERKEERQREIDQAIQMPWDIVTSDCGYAENQEERRPFESQTAVQSSDTILLNGEMTGNNVQVKRLAALDPDAEDIVIAYYPFIIGKQENLVDYVLHRETVSRLHLRIDRKEDRYYVQDLNSTNGTMVAGHMLENNELMEIRDDVEISIAGVRYRFE